MTDDKNESTPSPEDAAARERWLNEDPPELEFFRKARALGMLDSQRRARNAELEQDQ
ncbi:MAG: hypothetical protein WD271_01220 [Acidimicrobiia bacterium]